jgi:hypothetical protein
LCNVVVLRVTAYSERSSVSKNCWTRICWIYMYNNRKAAPTSGNIPACVWGEAAARREEAWSGRWHPTGIKFNSTQLCFENNSAVCVHAKTSIAVSTFCQSV